MEDDAQRWILLVGNFDQDSPLRKGQALLREGKIAEAVAILEKAAEEDAGNQQLNFTLGRAYLRLPDENKAVEQFAKLLADYPDNSMLNSIAYEYANANRRLKDALDYASRAVADISDETMDVSLDSADPDNFLSMANVSADWDTLGWVEYRSGDIASAERYAYSAWMLSPHAVIGEHLVEIYEKLGKKLEADHICRLALEAPGLQDEPDTKEKLLAAQKRIGITAPETGTVSAKSYHPLGSGKAELSEMRTMKLPRKIELHAKSKIALFTIAIENNASAAKARYISGDKDLIPEAQALATVNYHQPFPDNSPVRILRAGWVSCSQYASDCSLVLFLVDDKPSLDMVKPQAQ